jgi:hypothetical protein
MPPIHQISPVVYASTFDGVEQLFEWYRGEIWGLSRLSYSNRKEIIQLIKEESEDVSDKLSLAKSAYYWVMANIQGNVGNIYYPSDVNDTFVTRRGRPIDRAILLMSIYKEMGISSELVLLNTIDESDDIWKYPTSSVVDMALVHILDLDGEEYFLDVNIKDLAFGDYWSDCYDKRCVFINEDGFESGRVPSKPTENNFVALTGIMKINGKGEMVMEGRREFCGLRSSYRTVFKDPKDREPLVESSLARSFSTITLTEITFNNVEDKDEPFSYDFRFISPYYGRISGDSVIIPSTPGRFNMTSAFIFSDKRKYPLHLNRYELYKDSIGIEIPDEYYFDYIPDDISIEEDFGEYRLEYSMMGDVLKVDRYLYLKDKTIDVDEYNDFVKFCDDIDKAEKMEIRISKK